MNPTLGLGKV